MITLLDEKVDIITGSPYHPHGAVSGVPGGRLLLSRNLSVLYNAFFSLHVYTYTSLFRVYKRDIVKKLKFESDGFVIAAEILIKALLAGYHLKEYPITLERRKYGSSKIKILKTIREHLLFLVRLKLQLLTHGKKIVLDER
jgi:dolichol-phosphate mannosyltransferase